MKDSAKVMFIFGLIAFGLITLIYYRFGVETDFIKWVFRVLLSLAAAAISISIPGMLELSWVKENGQYIEKRGDESNTKPLTLADKEPTITASGAIAVFVLVYIFNPIKF